jgi:hypothetical protein
MTAQEASVLHTFAGILVAFALLEALGQVVLLVRQGIAWRRRRARGWKPKL